MDASSLFSLYPGGKLAGYPRENKILDFVWISDVLDALIVGKPSTLDR